LPACPSDRAIQRRWLNGIGTIWESTSVPDNYTDGAWEQQAGPTGFAPFPEDTKSEWRFARLYDPEGNPIELWQPAERDARSSRHFELF